MWLHYTVRVASLCKAGHVIFCDMFVEWQQSNIFVMQDKNWQTETLSIALDNDVRQQ